MYNNTAIQNIVTNIIKGQPQFSEEGHQFQLWHQLLSAVVVVGLNVIWGM